MSLFISFLSENIVLIAALVAIIIYQLSLKESFFIECQELVSALNDNKALLIDLRPVNDFATGHIAGAINLDEEAAKIRIKKNLKRKIVLVHKNNSQAQSFRAKIVGKHPEILILNDGMRNWKQQQYPTVR